MKKRGKMKNIRMNKLGISLMVSYVLLISIGITLSIGVYIWLVDYANIGEKTDCKADTKLIVENYKIKYQKSDNNRTINLTIKNNGLFNISGFFITFGNDTKRIPKKAVRLYKIGYQPDPGFYDFEPPITPGDTYKNIVFRLEDLDIVEIMQIQPFIYDEDEIERIYCEQSLIKQNVLINPSLIFGLVSWWKFDGNILDVKSKNDGVIGGSPVYDDGELNQGLKFDGEEDYVNISDNFNLDMEDAITISAWIKLDDFGSMQKILTKRSDYDGYIFGIKNDGKLYGGIGDGVGFEVTDGVTILKDQWYHVSMVYEDYTDRLLTYINGTLVENMTTTKSLSVSGEELTIGAQNTYIGSGSVGQFFNGTIDEVAIYNKALTEWEILQLYNSYNLTG